jgi:ABC-2 type transport system permease protein
MRRTEVEVRRYLRLLAIQLRASALLAMQYRLDFALDALMSLFWTASALVPLLVLFGQRTSVAGWTWPEALLVVGWFTVLKAVLDGAIQPSLVNVVEHIRKGTLDFLLLKPADAQFMVSTSGFELWKVSNLAGGAALLAYAMHRLGRWPSAGGVLMAVALLAGAVLILYSIWILVVSLSFYVVKIDNLSYLFGSIYDAARWPSSIFRGALAFLFTFIIPLALMTTYPSLALLGRIAPFRVLTAVAGALVFAFVSRQVWLRALGHYTSAGG